MTPKQLIKNAFQTGFVKGISLLGGIGLQWLLTKNLTVSEVGYFITFLTFLMAVSVFIRYGSEKVLLRHGSQYCFDKNKKEYQAILNNTRCYILKRSAFFIVCSLCLFGVSKYIGYMNQASWLLGSVIIFTIPFFAILLPWASALRAQGKTAVAPFWEQGGVLAFTMITVFVVWQYMEASLLSAVIMLSIISVVLAIPIFISAPWSKCKGLHQYDGMSDYGITEISAFMTQWGVVLALSVFGEVNDVAYLSTAIRVAMLVNFVLIVFNSILAPQFSILYKNGQREKLKKLIKSSTAIMTIIAIPLAFALIMYPEYFMMLFGDEYLKASEILIILSVAQLFNVMSGSVLVLLNMSGYQRIVKKIVIASAIVTLIFIVPIINTGNLINIAYLMAIVSVFTNCAALFFAYKRIGFTTLPF